MNPRLVTAAFAATLSLTASALTMAQQAPALAHEAHSMQHGHRHGHGMHSHSGRHGGDGPMMPGAGMLHGLNLSEAQRDRVFTILHAQAPQLRTQTREAQQARQAMQQLALAGELDEAKLQDAAQRASRASTDLAMLRARTQNALFKELTPEQQAQVKTRMEQRGHRGGHHRAELGDRPHAS